MATETPLMAIEKFDELLDQHGPDVEAWPASEQGSARELLKMCNAARDRLDEERALSALLSTGAVPKAPAGLADKIIKKAIASS